MTETKLYDAYKQVLLYDTELWFHNEMSRENQEMFYRMKFRALNSFHKPSSTKPILNLAGPPISLGSNALP